MSKFSKLEFIALIFQVGEEPNWLELGLKRGQLLVKRTTKGVCD